jgi:hypothetical protein
VAQRRLDDGDLRAPADALRHGVKARARGVHRRAPGRLGRVAGVGVHVDAHVVERQRDVGPAIEHGAALVRVEQEGVVAGPESGSDGVELLAQPRDHGVEQRERRAAADDLVADLDGLDQP